MTSRVLVTGAGVSLVLAAIGLGVPIGAATAGTGSGSRACVVGGATTGSSRCFGTIQAAVDAAPPGGTVRLSAGRFAGGVVIAKSLHLVGEGSDRTRVHGGGPVILVEASDGHVPTVRISDLAVTGGRTDRDPTDPGSEPGFNALGGGIDSEPVSGQQGPNLTLLRVAVTGNSAEPGKVYPSPSGVECPDGQCPYAGAYGGGLLVTGDTWLVDSTVSHNHVGGHASDADGGGIFATGGSDLHVVRSVISDNKAAPASDDIGRFAEGGGIFTFSGNLDMQDSRVSGNVADLETTYPVLADDGSIIDMNANSGGIHVGDGGVATIADTKITGNVARAIDPAGEVIGIDAAMLVGNSELRMRDSLVSGNTTYAEYATAADVGPSGSALEVDADAHITGTKIVHNTSVSVSHDGVAEGGGTLAVFDFFDDPRQVTVENSMISGNTSRAESSTGSAQVYGAGVINNSLLRLQGTRVSDNQGEADAPDASAQGGGIWNGPLLSGPPVELTAVGSQVTRNEVVATNGTSQGGGIYSTVPIHLTRTRVVENSPDDCACTGPMASLVTGTTPPAGRARGSAPDLPASFW